MSASAPALPGQVEGNLARFQRVPGARYWGALLLVLASVVVRLLLDPIVGGGYGFTCFYPAVILSAYWLGPRPALFAFALSGVIAYGFVSPSPLGFQLSGRGAVALTFFTISSGLLIWVLSSIRGRLRELTHSYARVEALATGQAELFREHAQRTTDHLQLISAILQMRAYGEADPMESRVLIDAASRALLISRSHRAAAYGEGGTINFEDFGRRLAGTAAAQGGLSADRVLFSGGAVDVPAEQATALGLILLEYLTTLGAQAPKAILVVTLSERDHERVLLMAAGGGSDTPPPADIAMMDALADQLGGQLRVKRTPEGCDVRIAFPTTLQPPRPSTPLTVRLH